MGNFKWLFIPFAIFIWIGTLLCFVRYSKDLSKAMQERELQVIVNYAVDAAVQEMINKSEDLGMDYDVEGYVNVDPEVGLETFVAMFLKAYDMSPSEENISLVRTRYIPVFCVAAYDGYYIATVKNNITQPNGDKGYDLIFTPKVPYVYEDNGKMYALNLAGGKCYRVDYSNVAAYNNKLTVASRWENPLTYDKTLAYINSQVSDAITRAVYEEMSGAVKGVIAIPGRLSNIRGTMPIINTTAFAYVANIPTGWGGSSVDVFGIGGSRINKTRWVAVWKDADGKKWYQYADTILEREGAVWVKSNVIDYYNSPMEAALKGYYYHP